MTRATIRDVAKEAGVSVSSVSNFVNHPERLAPGIYEKIRLAIEKLGYLTDQRARLLSAGKSNLIGLLVEDVENPFFARLARGVTAAARRHDLFVVLGSKSHLPGSDGYFLDAFEANRFCGVIAAVADPSYLLGRLDSIRSRGAQVIMVGNADRSDICSVTSDSRLGGRLAADHLASLGHRRIAVMSPEHGFPACDLRVEGFVTSLTGQLRDAEISLVGVPDLGLGAGESATPSVIESEPTAVFCVSDLLAAGLLRGLAARGLTAPRDLSIVGYDDVAYAAVSNPPLTSVHQPVRAIGETVVDLLVDELSNSTAHQHRSSSFIPHLVVRASSTPMGLPPETVGDGSSESFVPIL